ncbi:arginyl-tRNA synthetase [Annulohypoxylon truncatum]|uniref:arginyl-tRNA synthetase n=1 Tax=Annulohypoxylon truncatum TaxID=327061 RepID=UPI0020074FAE|nr:arginyl-tRNA synthetase [Annulohypoxylon truncatum]KAI1204192.1 arginyl-tRNA synthetase [Annulohypoxylon truncatum]
MNIGRCLLHRTIIVRAIRSLRQPQSREAHYTLSSPNNLTRDTQFSPRLSVLQRRAVGTMAPANGINHLLSKLDNLTLESIADKYPATYPEVNPFDLYRVHIAEVLAPITSVAAENIRPVLSWTNALDKGDFILPIPALRIKGAKPDALGAEWAAKFPEDDPLFEKPVATGSFLSFFAKGGPLTQSLIPMIRELGADYGRNRFLGLKDPKNPGAGKKRIVVEFSSPNIAKPFHAGHLRSTIIGSFLANLYEGAGWDVVRINYLGDWGKQYGLLALAYERYGDEDALKKDPIDHLFRLYVRINAEKDEELATIEAKKKEGQDVTELLSNSLDEQARGYFRKMTDRDEKALALWQRFRDLSIVRYKATYARLNIKFDEYSGESQVSEEAMEKVAKEMAEKGVTREDQGAVLVDFTQLLPGKEGKRLGKAVIRKRDGTALYLTRDIAELLGRYEKYKFDHMIYVVASQQDLHLQQLFKIIDLLGYKDIAARCQHINFGLVQGMSTRKGTVKFLDDILRDCADHMHEVMRKNDAKYSQVEDPEGTADTLGISSVMTQDMSGKRGNNYTFDLAVMTSFEGDTGPYLQYAHTRLSSIRRRANVTDEELAKADLTLLTEPHAVNVVRLLAQWPDVAQNTLRTLEPTTVVTYLFRLTHVISSSYDQLQVVGSEPALKAARMALYDAAQIVVGNCMRLLGLSPLQRM